MKDRLKEPSTYAGIGLILLGLDQAIDINEAATVGQALIDASDSGMGIGGIGMALFGALMSIFLPEKK